MSSRSDTRLCLFIHQDPPCLISQAFRPDDDAFDEVHDAFVEIMIFLVESIVLLVKLMMLLVNSKISVVKMVILTSLRNCIP